LTSSDETLPAFFKKISPAVVALEVKTSRDRSYTGLEWRQRHNFGGTAFFIDPRGHLLTAASLVKDAGRIELTDAAGRVMNAGVVGISPAGGVALLRTVGGTERPVTHLTFGRSRDVKVGDRAFSLGSPFGTIERTGRVAISRGTVSGIYQVDGFGKYKGEVLETDAAVNPGAFGGPLLSRDGKVIGILLETFSYNRWLGTALPIDQVASLMDQLRQREEPGPGRIGIMCVERVIERTRARVTEVEEDSPAARAGLERGDEIIEFGGKEIEDFAEFLGALYSLPAGSVVDLRVLRPGTALDERDRLKRFSIKVGPPLDPVPAEQRGTLGLRLSEESAGSALEVEWVDPKGPAGREGIGPGDQLRLIEGHRANRKLWKRLLESTRQGERVKLRFVRKGWFKDLELVFEPVKKM